MSLESKASRRAAGVEVVGSLLPWTCSICSLEAGEVLVEVAPQGES